MPVLKWIGCPYLLCALLLLLGCRGKSEHCPVATITADPQEIPEGVNYTDVFVEVADPRPELGLEVITELTAISGTFAKPFARETTYACAHDVSGPVELCVRARYVGEDGADGGIPEADALEAEVSVETQSEHPDVNASSEYLRIPHVRIPDPLQCSELQCTTVTCPEEKNACPVVSSPTVEPTVVPEGGTAVIEVVADDPDDNPEALVTTLSARHGTIAHPSASTTTYTCDPEVGGFIEICVVASDGDSSCDVERCTGVRCPGEPLENTCPIIEALTATPMLIPPGETMTTVRVDAMDPDEFPVPLRIELRSETGVFDDRFASETTFTCGASGPVEICAKANDGDRNCDEESCITVQCPSDIPTNICPQLFIINGIPRVIPEGETSTLVQTRGQDNDGLPQPLTLTLSALWGTFENTENIQKPFHVVEVNATYICDRPGPVEVCVDATDGACTKTQCDNLTCPDDIPTPP
jgi:hypothetical protein